MTYPFTREDVQTLAQWDTPTICNALELLEPVRRGIGFTVEPMVALHPGAAPIVGLARVGTVRAKEPPRGTVAGRMAWYQYVWPMPYSPQSSLFKTLMTEWAMAPFGVKFTPTFTASWAHFVA